MVCYAIGRDILAIDRRSETKSSYAIFLRVITRKIQHMQLVYPLFFLSSEEFTRVCFVITISLVFVAWNEYFHGLANWNARKLSVSLPLFSWEWLSRDIIRMEIFETSCCIQLLQFEFSRKNILLNVPRAFF